MTGSFWKTLIDELTVVLIAALPLIELKGAIPIGMARGLSLPVSFWLSYFGSCLPAIPILLILRPILHYLSHTPTLTPIAGWLERKLLKHRRQIDRLGIFGLFLFVAIPLPGTGVWTGSGLSAILKMKFWPSVIAIYAGNLVAGFIIAALSWGISLV